MTANNKAKRKRTKKRGVFKRLEERELKRDIEALIKIAVLFSMLRQQDLSLLSTK